jgi:hypothetical protein
MERWDHRMSHTWAIVFIRFAWQRHLMRIILTLYSNFPLWFFWHLVFLFSGHLIKILFLLLNSWKDSKGVRSSHVFKLMFCSCLYYIQKPIYIREYCRVSLVPKSPVSPPIHSFCLLCSNVPYCIFYIAVISTARDCAISRAISRRLLTAAALVPSQVRLCGI